MTTTTSADETTDLTSYARTLGERARAAGLRLAATDAPARTAAIRAIATQLRSSVDELLAANAADLRAAASAGLATPMQKRLALDAKKVEAMARAVDEIADQPDPIGHVIESRTRDDGLRIGARPRPDRQRAVLLREPANVTTDAAALCLRSGNAVVLPRRQGIVPQAIACWRTSSAAAMSASGIDADAVQVVETTDRALLPMLLAQDKTIDLVIPRGGHSLIRAVVDHATMPVLKHFDGNCHVYVDASSPPLAQVVDVIVNAKNELRGRGGLQRGEHVLVHRDVAKSVMSPLIGALQSKQVEVRGDAATRSLVAGVVDATDEDWDVEYLAFIVGVKVVDSLDAAIDHINRHGSHHTDAILSSDAKAIAQFTRRVDSASIMVNASTRPRRRRRVRPGRGDRHQHGQAARPRPMGAFDMTTYKWVVTGDGHVRG